MDTNTQLQQIEKISQNTRATWLALLALLVFVGVTLLGHKDSDFFASGAETQLPLVNISVPTTSFFIAAPVFASSLYIYLHIYLGRLWTALAKAPARIDDDPLEEHIYPSIEGTSALILRRLLRASEDSPVGERGRASLFISIFVTWAFSPLILAFAWWRSWPYHDEWLTLWIGFWLWLAIITAIESARFLYSVMRGIGRTVGGLRFVRLAIQSSLSIILVAMIAVVGWAKTEGGLESYDFPIRITHERVGSIISLQAADLSNSDISKRPQNWKSFPIWFREFEDSFRQINGLKGKLNEWNNEHQVSFFKEAKSRWQDVISSIGAPNLQGADLRFANLSGAFLVGVDLSNAQISESKLDGAVLDGANLKGARVNGSSFRRTSLAGADLSCDEITRTYVEEDCLSFEMQNLRGVRFDLANLSHLAINRSDLSETSLVGSNCQQFMISMSILNESVFGCDIDLGLSNPGSEKTKTYMLNGKETRYCLQFERDNFYDVLEIAAKNSPEAKLYGSDPDRMGDAMSFMEDELICE